jgi:hypothetical protein
MWPHYLFLLNYDMQTLKCWKYCFPQHVTDWPAISNIWVHPSFIQFIHRQVVAGTGISTAPNMRTKIWVIVLFLSWLQDGCSSSRSHVYFPGKRKGKRRSPTSLNKSFARHPLHSADFHLAPLRLELIAGESGTVGWEQWVLHSHDFLHLQSQSTMGWKYSLFLSFFFSFMYFFLELNKKKNCICTEHIQNFFLLSLFPKQNNTYIVFPLC